MIIWLASYPKSGNTWVRIFLNLLLFSKENQLDFNKLEQIPQFPQKYYFEGLTENFGDMREFVKNCIDAQSRCNLENKTHIFKTHNAFWKSGEYSFTDEENSLGVIYIVRDPRSLVTSLKNHYFLKNDQDSINFMSNEKKIIKNAVLSSWNNHFNSWKKFKKNYLLIKYENLLKNPGLEFRRITNFLKNTCGVAINESKIDTSIKLSEFSNLKKKEENQGFIEAPKTKDGKTINFFNLGPKNDWKKLIKNETAKEIEKIFEKEMVELGYI